MQKALLAVALMTTIFVAGCTANQPNNVLNFAGQELHFRADLSEAAKVPVIPDSSAILNMLLNPDIEGIRIAFVPNDTENGFYGVTGYEIAYKLTIIEKSYIGWNVPIDTIVLNSSSDLANLNATMTNPIIFMQGPGAGGTETAVTVDGALITVSADELSSSQARKWSELDRAADKLLLVMIGAAD